MMAVAAARRAPFGPMLGLQTWAEFLKLWRVPSFTLTSLFLPVMFYAFIGVARWRRSIFIPRSVATEIPKLKIMTLATEYTAIEARK